VRKVRNIAIVLALIGTVLLGWGVTERVSLPPFGPLPCPNSRLFEISEARWSNPVDRQRLLVRVGVKYGAKTQERLSRSNTPQDTMGHIMSDLVSENIGMSPTPDQFTFYMNQLGLKCRNIDISQGAPLVGGLEIQCGVSYPGGCPSKYGHWPSLVSGSVFAMATYTAGRRQFVKIDYSSGAVGP